MSIEQVMEIVSRDERFMATVYVMNSLLSPDNHFECLV
jgi:hypothetical protein